MLSNTWAFNLRNEALRKKEGKEKLERGGRKHRETRSEKREERRKENY
jgi:hypothetical protein